MSADQPTWSLEDLQPASVPRATMRRDRHGRGLRGPLLAPVLPAWRTRRERFDDLVIATVRDLRRNTPQIDAIQFAVEDVPPSDPAPWEHGIVLGRGFAAEPRAGLAARVVIYRRPIESRCETPMDMAELVRHVLVEQVASMLGLEPEQIDPSH